MKSIKKLGIALALLAPCILAAPAVPAFEPLRETELEAQELIIDMLRTDVFEDHAVCWLRPCRPLEPCCILFRPGAA